MERVISRGNATVKKAGVDYSAIKVIILAALREKVAPILLLA